MEMVPLEVSEETRRRALVRRNLNLEDFQCFSEKDLALKATLKRKRKVP